MYARNIREKKRRPCILVYQEKFMRFVFSRKFFLCLLFFVIYCYFQSCPDVLEREPNDYSKHSGHELERRDKVRRERFSTKKENTSTITYHDLRSRLNPTKAPDPKVEDEKPEFYFPAETKDQKKCLSGTCIDLSVIIHFSNINSAIKTFYSMQETIPEFISTEYILIDDRGLKKQCKGRNTKGKCFHSLKPLRNSTRTNIFIYQNDNIRGFYQSINQGLETARGTFTCVSDQSSQPQPFWLEKMLDVFELFPDAGIVGPKLLDEKEIILSTGGVLISNGTAILLSAKKTLWQESHKFTREVNFFPSSFFVTKEKIYLKNVLNVFLSSYREKSLCSDAIIFSKMYDLGIKAFYSHLSFVESEEVFPSSEQCDKDASWKNVKCSPGNNFYDQFLVCSKGPKVLYIDETIPEPDLDSGSLRAFTMLKIFMELDSQITMVDGSDTSKKYGGKYKDLLNQNGIEYYGPQKQSLRNLLESRHCRFDYIVIARSPVATYFIQSIKQFCTGKRTKVIIDTVDLVFLREAREEIIRDTNRVYFEPSLLHASPMEYPWGKSPLFNHALSDFLTFAQADEIIVVSNFERNMLHHINDRLKLNLTLIIKLISNIHDLEPTYTPFSKRDGIVFTGNWYHPPNQDGIKWFLENVWSSLRSRLPNVVLHLTGGNAPKQSILDLIERTPGVVFEGYVQDLRKFYSKMKVAIAPLQYGAGVKGKVNSAMKYGVPTVCTDLAAEGMNLTDGKNTMIANAPLEFAEAIFKLYTNEKIWVNIVDGGYANIENNFSPSIVKSTIQEIFSEPIEPYYAKKLVIPRLQARNELFGHRERKQE